MQTVDASLVEYPITTRGRIELARDSGTAREAT
jgi:hypothetical protein